jgi:protein-tyrosine phosphatase
MRGSRIDNPDGYKFLVKHGFKGIVDLRAEGRGDVGYGAAEAGLEVRRIPIIDNEVPTPADVAQFIQFVLGNGSDSVFVHCEAGIGRTGVMCAAWRIIVQKWDAHKALDEALTFGKFVPAQQDFILTMKAVT